MKTKVLTLLWLFPVVVSANVSPISPKRNAGESFEAAASKYNLDAKPAFEGIFGSTAYLSRTQKIANLDSQKVSTLQSLDELQSVFESYRDLRYLADPESPGFLRRLSWMYPDDGCFARAELFGFLAEQDHLPPISKIFVFGDLNAMTPNHPEGFVNWWYHVAPLYRVGEELYVLDPSVEPSRPLTRAEWGTRVGDKGGENGTSLEWAICAAHTFDPSSECQFPNAHSEEAAKNWIGSYLRSERYRMQQLGRNVDDVLGDNPPWLSSSMGSGIPAPIGASQLAHP